MIDAACEQVDREANGNPFLFSITPNGLRI